MNQLIFSHTFADYFSYVGVVAGMVIISVSGVSMVLRKIRSKQPPKPVWAACVSCERMQHCLPWWDEFNPRNPSKRIRVVHKAN